MKLLLADLPLKHLLRLFAADAPLHIQEMADTWHPSSGFVDEALVSGVARVEQLLAHAHDFAGLVYLEATVGRVTLHYRQGQYQLEGSSQAIEKIMSRIQALNAEGKLNFVVLHQG
ncbi:MAG: hypothetical protein ACRYFX_04450 [Janthinobacterium lividum]